MTKSKKEPGKHSMKRMKKVQKQRQTDLKNTRNIFGIRIVRDTKRKKEKIKRSIADEVLLNKVAFDLSRKFAYSKLVASVKGRGGFSVHGYMEKTYLNYDWLIDNMVLDRACFYAKKDYIPEIITFVREIDIKNYQRSVVETSEEICFENYPQFPFNKIIVYSKESLDEAVKWIDEYPWELGGYDTFVNLGPANLGLIGWATWDIPIVIILHAPGKNEAFFKAKISSEDLKNEKIEHLKNFIYQNRTYISVMEEKIDETKLESLQYQKLFSDLKRRVLTESPLSTDQEYAKFERDHRAKKKPFKLNTKTILWTTILIIIAAIVLILIFNTMSYMNFSTNSTYNNSTISITRLVLNLFKM